MSPTHRTRARNARPALALQGGAPASRSPDHATVLLVDDDDAFRETLVLWLSNDDRWDVREAATGREALAKLDESVDLLVLDRRMPDLSGDRVVERLDETSFDGSVLVVSAYRPDENLAERDVESYLIKPVDREELVDHLERHLG